MTKLTPLPPLPNKAEANVRLLAILLAVQLFLGAVWTITLISYSGVESGYYSFVLAFILFPIHLVFMGIAAGSIQKYRANLKFAIPVLTVPLIFLALPFLINSLAGGAPALRSQEQIVRTIDVLVVVPILLAIFFPRKIARFLPEFLLRSFWFNLLNLCVPLFIYLAYGLALAKWSAIFSEASSDDAAGYIILYGLLFGYLFALVTIIPLIVIFLYSYLGLFQKRVRKRRGMRIAQLVLSFPAIILGGYIMFRIISEGRPSP